MYDDRTGKSDQSFVEIWNFWRKMKECYNLIKTRWNVLSFSVFRFSLRTKIHTWVELFLTTCIISRYITSNIRHGFWNHCEFYNFQECNYYLATHYFCIIVSPGLCFILSTTCCLKVLTFVSDVIQSILKLPSSPSSFSYDICTVYKNRKIFHGCNFDNKILLIGVV